MIDASTFVKVLRAHFFTTHTEQGTSFKNFEFVSVNPSSVQGPGRVSGTAKILISTLSKTNPPLIRNNISIVDIDDCTDGHYNALEFGKNNERYVLNSFQTSSEELVNKLKAMAFEQTLYKETSKLSL